MDHIKVTRSTLPPFEEYCAEIRELWDSRWLTNMGQKHEQLRRRLEEYLGVRHVTLFANGHLALEGALAALALPPGSEVITTPFTFASTTHAIVRSGLKPVFCDIRQDDFTLDADRLEACVTQRTSAILPVHVYGGLCDVEAIGKIAARHGLRVVYDAAHAFGVRLGESSAACFGDISVFSFHATKVYNTVEGGAACYRDDALLQPLDDCKNFGIRDAETVAGTGGNAKLNELQAAMGLCNLRHLPEAIEGRRRVDERYRERLTGVPGLRLPAARAGQSHNYSYFPVLFEGDRLTRDEAFRRLAENGVDARKYFYPLTCDFDCYRALPADVPVARYVARRVLTLPLYPDLPLEEADRICDILLK